MATEYYEGFRPAIGLYEEEQEDGGEAFTEASDRGLYGISQMEAAAEELDEVGERLSEEPLTGWTKPR